MKNKGKEPDALELKEKVQKAVLREVHVERSVSGVLATGSTPPAHHLGRSYAPTAYRWLSDGIARALRNLGS